MEKNDILRSLRYALDVNESELAKVIALSGYSLDKQDIIALLKKEDEPGFIECDDVVLTAFLNGLIIRYRGPATKPIEKPVQSESTDNNAVLRKLRIAFELKDDDVLDIMTLAGFRVSRPEINALFRRADHKNFRPCGDQFLRNFLKGLSMKMRTAK